MKYFLFTNSPSLATFFDSITDVETIFVDLETLGKRERQPNPNTFVSNHSLEDVSILRKVIKSSQFGVRINPVNPNTVNEIKLLLNCGVDVIMLPFFHSLDEVNFVLEAINGKASLDLLLETPSSLLLVDKLPINSVRNFHFGLNDLSISLQLNHIFSAYFNDQLIDAASFLHSSNAIFGFGGVGRVYSFPISSFNVLSRSYSLRGQRLILARSFINSFFNTNGPRLVYDELHKFESILFYLSQLSDSSLNANDASFLSLLSRL